MTNRSLGVLVCLVVVFAALGSVGCGSDKTGTATSGSALSSADAGEAGAAGSTGGW